MWFTFNLVVNFLQNKNLGPGGNPAKILRWISAVGAAYPYDASMVALVCRAQRMTGDPARAAETERRFHQILEKSPYWQTRVRQFPELADLVKG
jgi:hypothetical protein